MSESKPTYEIGERGEAEITGSDPEIRIEVKIVLVSLNDLIAYWVKDYKEEWEEVVHINDVQRGQVLLQLAKKET